MNKNNPAGVEVVRFPLPLANSEEVHPLPVPDQMVVVGAAVFPQRPDGLSDPERLAKSFRVSVDVDGERVLHEARLDAVLAVEGVPLMWRLRNLPPVVLTRRVDPAIVRIEVERVARVAPGVAHAGGWEVWLYVAR